MINLYEKIIINLFNKETANKILKSKFKKKIIKKSLKKFIKSNNDWTNFDFNPNKEITILLLNYFKKYN